MSKDLNNKKKINNNKKIKVKRFNNYVLIISLVVVFIMLLVLFIFEFIKFNRLEVKINTITKLSDDVVLLNSKYEEMLEINDKIDVLKSTNDDYKKQISSLKSDIEKLDIKISKLENTK